MRPGPTLRFAALWLLACALPAWAWAADDGGLRFGGHFKYQYGHTDHRADDLAALLVDRDIDERDVDFRLKADGRRRDWDFGAHYEVLATSGSDALALRQRLIALGISGRETLSGLPDDRRRLFDLTREIGSSSSRVAVHRLDRLAIGNTRGGTTMRFGRQAVSWGNGLVFHPLDFVNPFSPIAIDKDYKTGDDMLYVQQIIDRGGDVQGMVVPRRDITSGEVRSAESTAAAKLRWRIGEADWEWLAARHFDDSILGVALVRSVGGAVWRLDGAYTALAAGGSAWSAVTNMDYSWVWAGRNVYGYVEYFRNGFGEASAAGYAQPNDALAERLARGEVYTLGRDYLALGMQVEFTPLVNVHANVIRNLNDSSHFGQLRAVYDWRENVTLMAGINVPLGERGDEFGGVPVPGAYLAAGRTTYVRVAFYF